MLDANTVPTHLQRGQAMSLTSDLHQIALRPLLKRRLKSPVQLPKTLPAPQKKNHILDLNLADSRGNPIAFAAVEVVFASGQRLQLRTNEWGAIYIDQLTHAGTFTVNFPELKTLKGC